MPGALFVLGRQVVGKGTGHPYHHQVMATPVNADSKALGALHLHFLAASMFKPSQTDEEAMTFDLASKLDDEMKEVGEMWWKAVRVQVFYSLLYVVVEGYQELGCQDPEVDRLLSRTDLVDSFRRFRNAVFHVQRDPFLSPKLMEFLKSESREMWALDLYRALDAFFQKNPLIQA